MATGETRPASDESAAQERCGWASGELLGPYHDAEWGVPVHDDRRHYEFLVLEGAQAGLSWLTILRRREGYRQAFCDFDPEAVARFGQSEIDARIADPSIIRNRLKVESAVKNARAFIALTEERGSFDSYVWDFVGGSPIVNSWEHVGQLPAETELSRALSKDMRARGFSFVGPVVIYAHLQATGLVMDHITSCFRWRDLAGDASR